jgi:hypothetical protein
MLFLIAKFNIFLAEDLTPIMPLILGTGTINISTFSFLNLSLRGPSAGKIIKGTKFFRSRKSTKLKRLSSAPPGCAVS